jgi:TusA-related sulfurtransferase
MMRTVSALKKLTGDEQALEVVTDHAPALETIPTQAARLGFRTDIEESGASEWRITITRTEVEEGA